MTRSLQRSLCLSMAVLGACAHDAAPAAITTRDSAGISIIEHPAGAVAAAPAWSLGAPRVTIGGGEGEDQAFSFIVSAHRLPDGRLVLADNETQGTRFLVYSADGKFVRRLGRGGDGPGEFRNARVMGLLGDTLVIYDIMNTRVTWMLPDGKLLRTADLSRLGPTRVGMPIGLLGEGRLLSTPLPIGDTTDHGSGPYRQAGAALVVDPQAMTLDTLQSFPGTEVRLMQMSFGGMTRSLPAPLGYGKRTLYGTGGGLVHVVTNAGAEVATYRLPWAPARLVRFAEPVPRVDQAARDAQIAEAVANIENSTTLPAAFKTSMLETVRNAAFADSMAPFQSLTVGADGSLWLRVMRSVADSTPRLLVVGDDGRLAARVDLPKGARLLWTDGADALVALTDENDLPRLELRPVIKGTADR